MPSDNKKEEVNPAVQERIERGDPWYVASQFAWAQRPEIRFIYEKRFEYFCSCLERVKKSSAAPLRMLDAGCGDGYWISRLESIQDVEIEGVDYNPLRVERAKQILARANIRVLDILHFETVKPFDVVLLNQVIEHVKDDAGLLRKMLALLRPGGVLILGTTNEGSWIQQWSLRRGGGLSQTDHVHFYTEEAMRKKIIDAGFRIESMMREVFYVGSDRLYYALTRRRWGFRMLEALTKMFPSQCSGFYFECVAV